MRTRRSEGVRYDEVDSMSSGDIKKSPKKKRLRQDVTRLAKDVRRRVTRSRLAIVELPASETEDECIGDLAPYNRVKRSLSYTRHRKLQSPGRPISIPQRRNLRNQTCNGKEDLKQEIEDDDKDQEIDKKKTNHQPKDIISVVDTAREHYGIIDMNLSLVEQVRARSRRRQQKREQEQRQQEIADDDEDDEGEDDEAEDEDNDKGYSLRRNRCEPTRYGEIVVDEPRRMKVLKQSPVALFSRSGAHRSSKSSNQNKSLSRKKMSTASSSSSSSSSDEEHFQKKKRRQMEKSRLTMLPMNLTEDQVNHRFGFRDRERIGASLADVDPMEFDKSITFESVGGHPDAIRQLQEMIVLPLLYPNVFSKFKIAPPRGVLFHGPPGTGKTLIARALVNECSKDGKKVAFFMRKGSDVLSKWVGESERQLRLLFDQAFRMRPSVIFFDEIDGLAPVRSSRQDHIHSSIVSTLLALMDGLDSRGEVVIIGATNRIDSIDPALRRPGRFDREINFQLPGADARKEILKIHTREWEKKPSNEFIELMAMKTNGYCGADLKALCTESVLNAFRRTHPSVYRTRKRIAINYDIVNPKEDDFEMSMSKIVPATVRSDSSASVPLSSEIGCLLDKQLNSLLSHVEEIWPQVALKNNKLVSNDALTRKNLFGDHEGTLAAKKSTYRPRLMLTGAAENGQEIIAAALLDALDDLNITKISLSMLYSCSTRTTEDALAEAIRNASQCGCSVIYIPQIILLWEGLTETTKSVFISTISSIPSSQGTIIIATTNKNETIPIQLKKIFDRPWKDTFCISLPTDEQRAGYFNTIKNTCKLTVKNYADEAECILKNVDFEEEEKKVTLTEDQKSDLEKKEESTMRTLRIFLRNIVTRLAQDKRFKEFTKPVDPEEIPDYYDIIENPMDLSIIMVNIDEHHYETVEDMLADIQLIVDNALEYNPDNYHEERMIRHRACLLKDFAHEMVERELDNEFEKTCQEIKIARQLRGANKTKFAPQFLDVEEDDKSAKEFQTLLDNIANRDTATGIQEGSVCWVNYRDSYHLCKLIKVKAEYIPYSYYVQLIIQQKFIVVQNEKLRNVIETDDVNSILKSPAVKSRKKKRKRSSWASGIIKKSKRPSLKYDSENDEHDEQQSKEEEITVRLDIAENMDNETSNDSNKENIPSVNNYENTPTPFESLTNLGERRPLDLPKDSKTKTNHDSVQPNKTNVNINSKKNSSIEEIWTVDEIRLAKAERDNVQEKVIIEEELLDQTFNKIVEKSCGWNAEKIIEFGCHLNSIIYKYRLRSDRMLLCEDLAKTLEFM